VRRPLEDPGLRSHGLRSINHPIVRGIHESAPLRDSDSSRIVALDLIGYGVLAKKTSSKEEI
jgi:hypothetical protein